MDICFDNLGSEVVPLPVFCLSNLPQLCLSPFRCWLHDEVMGPGFEDSCAHYIFRSCVWSILD